MTDCYHPGAKIRAVRHEVPLYANGRLVNQRVIIQRQLQCKVCGNKILPDHVALRTDIDPSWNPKQSEEDSNG